MKARLIFGIVVLMTMLGSSKAFAQVYCVSYGVAVPPNLVITGVFNSVQCPYGGGWAYSVQPPAQYLNVCNQSWPDAIRSGWVTVPNASTLTSCLPPGTIGLIYGTRPIRRPASNIWICDSTIPSGYRVTDTQVDTACSLDKSRNATRYYIVSNSPSSSSSSRSSSSSSSRSSVSSIQPLPLPAVSPNFSIMNSASGMCVHPSGGSAPSNGTLAILYEGCEEARLQFTLTAAGSIKHLESGMCLHPSGGATNPANGTALVFWNGCDEARLQFEWQNNQLRHISSGKCVQTRGFYRAAILELDACTTSPKQSFKRSAQSGYLVRHSSGLCLKPVDDVSHYPAMNTDLILSNSCSLANPRHRFVLTDEGFIRHVASGMCVHPAGGSATPINGTRLVLFPSCSDSSIVFSHINHVIRQTSSGKCVHPSGGATVPANGTHAVLWDGCVSEPKVNFFGQLPDSLTLFTAM